MPTGSTAQICLQIEDAQEDWYLTISRQASKQTSF